MKTINIVKTIGQRLAKSILCFTFMATGCQNDGLTENCEGDNAENVETFFSKEFADTPCGVPNFESTEKETHLLITSQAEFKKYFACPEQLPEIDFEKYLVLAGSYTHHQCAGFESQQVITCGNRIIYKVRLFERDCQAVTSVFYGTIIEKKYNSLPVSFDVKFNK